MRHSFSQRKIYCVSTAAVARTAQNCREHQSATPRVPCTVAQARRFVAEWAVGFCYSSTVADMPLLALTAPSVLRCNQTGCPRHRNVDLDLSQGSAKGTGRWACAVTGVSLRSGGVGPGTNTRP